MSYGVLHCFKKEKKMKRIKFDNREDWLANRNKYRGIGGSEAPIAMGISPWNSPEDLWELKTGRKKPKDISNLACVKYGVDMEPLIREQFKLDCPQFKVEYHGYDLLVNDDYPFIFCTLDGELTDRIGRKGVFEAKTGSFRNKQDLEVWSNHNTPEHYFAQGCHQLLTTGWDFIVFAARLKRDGFKESDNGLPEIVNRYIYFERDDIQDSIDAVLDSDKKFWKKVQTDQRPNTILKSLKKKEITTWQKQNEISNWW